MKITYLHGATRRSVWNVSHKSPATGVSDKKPPIAVLTRIEYLAVAIRFIGRGGQRA
ncbi:MAG: hypothetical protein ABI216_00955 [Devosia sp.]